MEKNQLTSDFNALGIKMHDRTLPVYKYTSAATAKIILENCSIRFSIPSNFNDPFEFTPDWIDFNITDKQYREKGKKLLRENKSFNDYEINICINQTTPSEFKKAYQNKLISQRDNSLVFCSSERNDDILMWSHYAENHKGICLGLLMPEFEANLECFTAHVNYLDDIHPIKYFDLPSKEKQMAFTKWIFNKAKCWSYERELRSLITNENCIASIDKDGYLNVSLVPFQICEIYFGINTSEANINYIKDMLEKKKYNISKIKKMKAEKGKYSLKPFPLQS